MVERVNIKLPYPTDFFLSKNWHIFSAGCLTVVSVDFNIKSPADAYNFMYIFLSFFEIMTQKT